MSPGQVRAQLLAYLSTLNNAYYATEQMMNDLDYSGWSKADRKALSSWWVNAEEVEKSLYRLIGTALGALGAPGEAEPAPVEETDEAA